MGREGLGDVGDDESWRGVLWGSGPIPFRTAAGWLFMGALGTVLWIAVVFGGFPYVAGEPHSAGSEFWRIFIIAGMPYTVGYAVLTLARDLGWIPAAWGRQQAASAYVARPFGVLGSSRWKLAVRGTVSLRKAADRRVVTAKVVWVECESRVLPIACSGPGSDAAVEDLAAWLRARGCSVTADGSFDEPWAPTEWPTRQGLERR